MSETIRVSCYINAVTDKPWVENDFKPHLEREGKQIPAVAIPATDYAALTRQRDELAEAVRQTLSVFHDKCSDYDHASWNPDAHIEVTLTIADLRRLAAALRRGEVPHAK